MTTKAKRGSEEWKQKLRGPRPNAYGNTNGVVHGLSQTREYNSWKKMMFRCNNPEAPDYPNYGGRGIEVCERWHDVRNFCTDMVGRWGEREKGFTLERVNVEGNYEPSNCCWVPMGMQSKNRRPWKHTPEGLEAIAQARRDSAK